MTLACLERRGRLSSSNQEPNTPGSGKADLEMGMESKSGKMEQGILESGKTIGHTGKEGSSTLTKMNMKENGKMTKQMASVYISMQTEQHMKEIGMMIFKKEEELSDGLMARYSKESTMKERNTDTACTNGTTDQALKANGLRTRSKDS